MNAGVMHGCHPALLCCPGQGRPKGGEAAAASPAKMAQDCWLSCNRELLGHLLRSGQQYVQLWNLFMPHVTGEDITGL